MKETDIQQLVRIRASELGCTLWRNNTGKLQNKDGRWVTYGLCVGSPDLIGIYKGKFVGIEIKQPNKKPTKEQQQFIDFVNKSGGIAAVVYSPDELENILKTQ